MGWHPIAGGTFVWLVPFAVSCLFIGPEDDAEEVMTDPVFQTAMIIVGSAAATFATIRCAPRTTLAGVKLALSFLLVNWALDLAVLVPLIAADTGDLNWDAWIEAIPVWFARVGARYIGFVMMCVAAGANAERALDDSYKPL